MTSEIDENRHRRILWELEVQLKLVDEEAERLIIQQNQLILRLKTLTERKVTLADMLSIISPLKLVKSANGDIISQETANAFETPTETLP